MSLPGDSRMSVIDPPQTCSRCDETDESTYNIEACHIDIGGYERRPFLCRFCRREVADLVSKCLSGQPLGKAAGCEDVKP